MPDTPAPTPAPGNGSETPKKKRSHGEFNVEQLAEIGDAAEILAAAQEAENKAALAKQGITEAWLTSLATKLATATSKTTEANTSQDDSADDTEDATDTRLSLLQQLRDVQKAAKQKQRMDATDDDPTTNFTTEGYFIGKRLHPNQDTFLANARAISAKAKSDALPGIGPVEIQALDAAIAAHVESLQKLPQSREAAGKATAVRNDLIEQITHSRIALQYAADRAYPPANPLTAPARKRFHLDPNKGLGV